MIRNLAMTVALAVAAPAALFAQTPLPQAEIAEDAAIAAAVGDMSAGRHDAALARLDPIIAGYEARYAGEKRVIYCAASMEETLAYMLRAAAAKRSAVAIAPGWCGALFIKGFVLVDAHRSAEGQALIERANAMRPGYPHYLNELGYVLAQQKQWQASYDAYAKAADDATMAGKDLESAERARAWRGMGFALIEQGKWDEAEAMFRKCLVQDPNDGKARNELRYIAEHRAKAA